MDVGFDSDDMKGKGMSCFIMCANTSRGLTAAQTMPMPITRMSRRAALHTVRQKAEGG